MKGPEENINHQEDKSLEIQTGLEMILEIALETHKIEIEGYQEDNNLYMIVCRHFFFAQNSFLS